MNIIKSFKDAKTLWSVGKIVGRPSLTNFYLSQHLVERAINRNQFFGIAQPGCSIMWRRDRDFHHLYLHFSNRDVVNEMLNELPISTPVVADIIQRGNSHAEMVAALRDSGFVTHRVLERLNRSPGGLPQPSKETTIEVATLNDAEAILIALETSFDRFSEQLPEFDQIEVAITNNYILVCRQETQIAGFLFYEPSGNNTILRYWYVKEEFRNQNVGSSLIRHYLTKAGPHTLSQLWVVSDNHKAINKYQYYGYVNDVLSDEIMIRK